MRVDVTVIPRSSCNQVIENDDGSLRVKLTAPPVDGEANKKLVAVLAEHYEVKKSAVTIVRGETSKRKYIHIEK